MHSAPVILIPIRSFRAGKSRLAATLPPTRRRLLIEELAGKALAAASEYDLRVLTPDEEVARWATGRGALVLGDAGSGLNRSLEVARAALVAAGTGSVAVLFADLPAVSNSDVAELMTLPDRAGAVIAPDRHGTGTNAIHAGAGSPLRFRFGPGSFAAHRAQVPGARILHRPGLANDLDEPADLHPPTATGP